MKDAGKQDRRGQVWENVYRGEGTVTEPWRWVESHVFLVVGREKIYGLDHESYLLLNLETGRQDSCWTEALDRPFSSWRRIA